MKNTHGTQDFGEMGWILNDTARLVLLFAGMFVLGGLELLAPLKANNRRHVVPNVLLTLGLILVNLLCASTIVYLSHWAESNRVGLFRIYEAPLLVEIIVSLLFLDFWASYISHWLLHKVRWLWRFHSVHHSDTMVDVTTAFRQHPVESIFRIAFRGSGMVMLGIPLWMLIVYLTLSSVNAQLEHANIRFPEAIDGFLQYFYVTPNMHKIHHSKLQPETDSNYSNLFSIWDRLFKTFRSRPTYHDVPYGLDYLPDRKRSFWSLLRLPFTKEP